MSKTQEEACGHAHQCHGCKLWYCSNDQVLHCIICIHEPDALCYRCLGVDAYTFRTICKGCWIDRRRGKLDKWEQERYNQHLPCYLCGKYRRTYYDKRGEDGTTIRTCRGCHKYKIIPSVDKYTS